MAKPIYNVRVTLTRPKDVPLEERERRKQEVCDAIRRVARRKQMEEAKNFAG